MHKNIKVDLIGIISIQFYSAKVSKFTRLSNMSGGDKNHKFYRLKNKDQQAITLYKIAYVWTKFSYMFPRVIGDKQRSREIS